MPKSIGVTDISINTPATEASYIQQRQSIYGDVDTVHVVAQMNAMAEEGTYFVTMGTTPNAGITQGISASVVETACQLIIYNDTAIGRNIIMDYVRLYNTVVPASAVRSEMQIAIDVGNRYSSGGTSLVTQNRNLPSGFVTGAVVKFGSITATTASANRRWIEYFQFKSAIPVVKDFVSFNFGTSTVSTQESFSLASATPSHYVFNLAPVIIGPGQTMLMYLFHNSNATTGASWAPIVSWYER